MWKVKLWDYYKANSDAQITGSHTAGRGCCVCVCELIIYRNMHKSSNLRHRAEEWVAMMELMSVYIRELQSHIYTTGWRLVMLHLLNSQFPGLWSQTDHTQKWSIIWYIKKSESSFVMVCVWLWSLTCWSQWWCSPPLHHWLHADLLHHYSWCCLVCQGREQTEIH